MKIIILGYGKIGKIIEKLVKDNYLNSDIQISKIINSQEDFDKTDFSKYLDCIVMDFSNGNGCYERILHMIQIGMKIISGTTGWEINLIEKIFENFNKNDSKLHYQNNKSAAFLHSSNFSIGVNIFWKIIDYSSNLIQHNKEYDVYGHEVHHNQKKDAPSGTAIKTQKIISKHMNIKPFTYERIDDFSGYHTVKFESEGDTIEISHNAKSREIFAKGAIKSAEWIKNKVGFFTINDFMDKNNH